MKPKRRGRRQQHHVIEWMRKHPRSLKMTIQEISDAMNVPYGSVNRQLFNARRAGIIRRVTVLEFLETKVRKTKAASTDSK